MTERPRKTVSQPKAPEKDSHGCVVGEEVWDDDLKKCVVRPTPHATVGIAPKSFHEQEALRSYKERK
jgi:hypothetical protein